MNFFLEVAAGDGITKAEASFIRVVDVSRKKKSIAEQKRRRRQLIRRIIVVRQLVSKSISNLCGALTIEKINNITIPT